MYAARFLLHLISKNQICKEKSIFPEDLYLSRAFIFIREFKYRRWEIYFYELVQRETESSLLVLPFFI